MHGNRGNGMCQWGPQLPGHSQHATPAMPPLVVIVALAVPAGLVAQWSEEDQKHQQTISIPLETYAQGCVKDMEEGLEVKPSPQAAACLPSTIISPWSLYALALLASHHM